MVLYIHHNIYLCLRSWLLLLSSVFYSILNSFVCIWLYFLMSPCLVDVYSLVTQAWLLCPWTPGNQYETSCLPSHQCLTSLVSTFNCPLHMLLVKLLLLDNYLLGVPSSLFQTLRLCTWPMSVSFVPLQIPKHGLICSLNFGNLTTLDSPGNRNTSVF